MDEKEHEAGYYRGSQGTPMGLYGDSNRYKGKSFEFFFNLTIHSKTYRLT